MTTIVSMVLLPPQYNQTDAGLCPRAEFFVPVRDHLVASAADNLFPDWHAPPLAGFNQHFDMADSAIDECDAKLACVKHEFDASIFWS
jgi:hypothetical protein